MDAQLTINECISCKNNLSNDNLISIPKCIKHNGDFEYVPHKNITCIFCEKCNKPILPPISLDHDYYNDDNHDNHSNHSNYNYHDSDNNDHNIPGRIYSNNKWKNYFVLNDKLLYYQLKDVKIMRYIVYFVNIKIFNKMYIIYVTNFLTDKEKLKVKKKENCIIS